MQAQLICNEAIIAVVNREKQPSHAIYSSDAAARIAHLRAPRNRQFSPGKYYRWQFSGVNIAIVRSKHSYFFFVIIIMAGGEHYVWHAHIFSVMLNIICQPFTLDMSKYATDLNQQETKRSGAA